ncbi:hypothetical protein DPMN_164859 [Dreissena polymorpha]|uniref:Uncharacterized protein n=1 Tax=Dreissena polymorpha TaxID=45954 RepID=A0A9D4EZA0_DREPO|nr:hypothetical protein DPMN_164859 [Dreissena polymorpha]
MREDWNSVLLVSIIKKNATLKEYTDIQHTTEKLKNVIVKRFRIYNKAPGSDKWSYMYDFGGVSDVGSVDRKEYNHFLCNIYQDAINRISIRLKITPASTS